MHQVSVAFFLIDSLKDLLIGIPWSLWSNFIVEQKHGFNKQTPLLFLTDQLKQVFFLRSCFCRRVCLKSVRRGPRQQVSS